MNTDPRNIYEAGVQLNEELERLRGFDYPTEVSKKLVGNLAPNARLLDVGAGSNVALGEYVRGQGAEYYAFDKNAALLEVQRAAGAHIVEGDVRMLPLADGDFDVVHARFVLAHLGEDKALAISQMVRVTKAGGRTIFMDYDWTAAHGSDAFNALRDLFIQEMLFEAAFGSQLEDTVKSALERSRTVTTSRFEVPRLADYGPVLRLREAANMDLELQGKNQLLERCNAIFDELQKESELATPPGFQFPDVVAVIVTE